MNQRFIIVFACLAISIMTFGQESNDKSLKCNSLTIENLRLNTENITDSLVLDFLLSLDVTCKNHVEFSEVSNETLFWLANIETTRLFRVINTKSELLDINFIILEFRRPVHDGIDLETIYKKIHSLKQETYPTIQILDSIKSAAKGLGINIE
jgi:hypothetical protein